jgi:DNA-binding CsgD family transcriptional regulator
VYATVDREGGIAPRPRRRSRLALTTTEREEISRQLARGESLRAISRMLGRAPSTLSREVARNALIRTLGGKFYKIRPVHSFSTQLTSGIVILTASALGLPVSTSQVVSSAIIGVGASERLGKVRWSVAEEIVRAWFITIPASALFSAGIYWLVAIAK